MDEIAPEITLELGDVLELHPAQTPLTKAVTATLVRSLEHQPFVGTTGQAFRCAVGDPLTRGDGIASAVRAVAIHASPLSCNLCEVEERLLGHADADALQPDSAVHGGPGRMWTQLKNCAQ